MVLNLAEFVRKKTLVKLGGQDFKFTELALGDMGQFRGRVQDQRKSTRAERAIRLMADAETIGGMDPKDILDRLDRPSTEEEYDAAAETIEGVIFLAFLSLQYAHPNLSEEQVGTMVPLGKLEEIVEAMIPGSKEKKSPKTLKEKRSRGVLRSRSSSGSTKGQSRGPKSKK